MEYIKLFEDFRILEKIPNKFFLVLRNTEQTLQSLSQLEFNGLTGLSDNPDIIHAFFDIRPILLVMDAKEVIKNNDLQKIDYKNPHQLVANNFKILSRLKQDGEEMRLWSIFNTFKNHIDNLTFIKNWKTREKNEPLIKTAYFFKQHEYEVKKILEKILEKRFKKGLVINNLWEFVNEILKAYKILKQEGNIKNSEESYQRHDFNEDYDLIINNPRYTYYIIQEILLDITKGWADREGEWIVKPNKISGERILKIPTNSTIYFKTNLDSTNKDDLEDIKKYKKDYKSWNDGFTDEEEYIGRDRSLKDLKDKIIHYNLDNLYNIQFIKGHYRAHDIFKDLKYTTTKTHSPLMANPMDKRRKKSYYKK